MVEDAQDRQDRVRAKEVAQGSCVHLVRDKDKWLEKYSTDEGKKAWLDGQDGYYKNPKSAAAGYRRLKKQAEQHHAIFGFKCAEGLPCKPTREIIGPFFTPRYTAAFCDMQPLCKAYRSVDQALVDLARFPKGSA